MTGDDPVLTMRCGHAKHGRNLIVCIDGTANQFGDKNTNVIELYNLVLKGLHNNQQTWYNSGIGTFAQPEGIVQNALEVIVHTIDQMTARSFQRTVQGAYRWLSEHYKEGDCIFLFGFSRGAFQVRTLSAMIDKVGLIHKGNEMQIPFAYELYMDPTSDAEQAAAVGSPPQKKQMGLSKAKRFKKAFSREVKVHFVGAWDTVSSIGTRRRKNVPPRTTTGMTHVCFFQHALALDERRVKFLPEYANGGSGPHGHLTQVDVSKKTYPHTLEVWFAGTHSDIGGGNTYNAEMNRSRPPLRWMVEQANIFGLRTAAIRGEHDSNEQINVEKSLTFFWLICEVLPLRRLTFNASPTAIPEEATRWPHLGAPRTIHEGQKIHCSLILAQATTPYIPRARPPRNNPFFWEQLREEGLGNPSGLLEIDLVGSARTVLKQLAMANFEPKPEIKTEMAEANLQAIVDHDESGPQVLYDAVLNAMEELEKMERFRVDVRAQVLARSLAAVMEILGSKLQCIKVRPPLQVPDSLAGPLSRVEDRVVVERFLRHFTDCYSLHQLHGHTAAVTSLAISSNGERIVSGSEDRTVRVWNAKTGKQVAEPLLEHTDSVTSVAISPDGEWVVSGSRDRTIRVWDANTGTVKARPLRGHTDTIICVAIFRIEDIEHGSYTYRIISGSADKTIRTWTWDPVGRSEVANLQVRHTDWAPVVLAISPDCKSVASGSCDGKIAVWDVDTGTVVAEPQPHAGSVTSVAFLPDGKRIVSGSRHEAIRLENIGLGGQAAGWEPRNQPDCVTSALASDGKHIISGCEDGKIRIWDVETGEVGNIMLHNHTDSVSVVAISPDSERIISGSRDKTIWIWDAKTITYTTMARRKLKSSVEVSRHGKDICRLNNVIGDVDKSI